MKQAYMPETATRQFRTRFMLEPHYLQLRAIAARLHVSLEEAHNLVFAYGLRFFEDKELKQIREKANHGRLESHTST